MPILILFSNCTQSHPPPKIACVEMRDRPFVCTGNSNPTYVVNSNQAYMNFETLGQNSLSTWWGKTYAGPTNGMDIINSQVFDINFPKNTAFDLTVWFWETSCVEPSAPSGQNCYRWFFAHNYPALEDDIPCSSSGNGIIITLNPTSPFVGAC